MTLNLNQLTKSILSTLFNLGADIVKDGTYTRPASLSAPTGVSAANEVTAAVKLLTATVPASVRAIPRVSGKEKILIRASELTAIPTPAAGDYITETLTGIRREILAALLDPTGQVWSFTTVRSLNQDYGDLAAHTTSEDWGDLTATTEIEDRGALYE